MDEIVHVNTMARQETMRGKTSELMLVVSLAPHSKALSDMIDVFDYLALDWVTSDDLTWDGSLPDLQIQKIKQFVSRKPTEGY